MCKALAGLVGRVVWSACGRVNLLPMTRPAIFSAGLAAVVEEQQLRRVFKCRTERDVQRSDNAAVLRHGVRVDGRVPKMTIAAGQLELNVKNANVGEAELCR